MKNNNLAKKVFIGMGIFALAIGINLATGLFQAKAQTSDYGPGNGSYYGMMGDIKNPDQFYQEMSDLMKKYNVNPIHIQIMRNHHSGGYRSLESNDYPRSGYGMMGGYRGGMMGGRQW